MRLAVVWLGVAALMTAGPGVQCAAAQTGGSPCPGGSTATDAPCDVPQGSDPTQNDLTPTQWLFGRDLGSKLTEAPSAVAASTVSNYNGWAAVRERADSALSTATTEAQPATPRRPDAVNPAAGREVSAKQSLSSRRFLIEEWRHTEIGVADSVYHVALMRIAAAFDSAQRPPIDTAERTRTLRRLDALLDANGSTWVIFRSQINRRADSALAALGR